MTPGLYVISGDPMYLWPRGIGDWRHSEQLMRLNGGEMVTVLGSCPCSVEASVRETPVEVVQVVHGSLRGTLFTTPKHTLRRIL